MVVAIDLSDDFNGIHDGIRLLSPDASSMATGGADCGASAAGGPSVAVVQEVAEEEKKVMEDELPDKPTMMMTVSSVPTDEDEELVRKGAEQQDEPDIAGGSSPPQQQQQQQQQEQQQRISESTQSTSIPADITIHSSMSPAIPSADTNAPAPSPGLIQPNVVTKNGEDGQEIFLSPTVSVTLSEEMVGDDTDKDGVVKRSDTLPSVEEGELCPEIPFNDKDNDNKDEIKDDSIEENESSSSDKESIRTKTPELSNVNSETVDNVITGEVDDVAEEGQEMPLTTVEQMFSKETASTTATPAEGRDVEEDEAGDIQLNPLSEERRTPFQNDLSSITSSRSDKMKPQLEAQELKKEEVKLSGRVVLLENVGDWNNIKIQDVPQQKQLQPIVSGEGNRRRNGSRSKTNSPTRSLDAPQPQRDDRKMLSRLSNEDDDNDNRTKKTTNKQSTEPEDQIISHTASTESDSSASSRSSSGSERSSSCASDEDEDDGDTSYYETDNIFSEEENIFSEEENIFSEEENVFSEEENVFSREENIFSEEENIFSEDDALSNVDTDSLVSSAYASSNIPPATLAEALNPFEYDDSQAQAYDSEPTVSVFSSDRERGLFSPRPDDYITSPFSGEDLSLVPSGDGHDDEDASSAVSEDEESEATQDSDEESEASQPTEMEQLLAAVGHEDDDSLVTFSDMKRAVPAVFTCGLYVPARKEKTFEVEVLVPQEGVAAQFVEHRECKEPKGDEISVLSVGSAECLPEQTVETGKEVEVALEGTRGRLIRSNTLSPTLAALLEESLPPTPTDSPLATVEEENKACLKSLMDEFEGAEDYSGEKLETLSGRADEDTSRTIASFSSGEAREPSMHATKKKTSPIMPQTFKSTKSQESHSQPPPPPPEQPPTPRHHVMDHPDSPEIRDKYAVYLPDEEEELVFSIPEPDWNDVSVPDSVSHEELRRKVLSFDSMGSGGAFRPYSSPEPSLESERQIAEKLHKMRQKSLFEPRTPEEQVSPKARAASPDSSEKSKTSNRSIFDIASSLRCAF